MLKRKILITLITIISFCLFFNVTYANNSGVVYLTSNQREVNKDDEIEITVNFKNNKIAACNFSLYFDDTKLDFIPEDTVANTNATKNYINFVWYDNLGGEGAKEGEIANFKFRAKENGVVTFTVNGEFYNKAGQLIQTEFKEEQVKIGKEESNLQKQDNKEQGTNLDGANSNLQALRIDREGLIPSFEKDIQEYYLNVPNDVQSIDILAISENPNAVVEINGNKNLQDKLNEVTIKVTSDDKTQSKTYTIHISKTDNLELANTNLEILAIENALLNPPFDTSNTNYKVEVSNNTENLNILAIPENEKATVQITGKDNLKNGNNLVTVTVKAQDGFTERSYRINVNRRNLEEEKRYQEEQLKQKEDLENAYNIEKTSVAINNSEEPSTKEQSKNYKNIVIRVVGILASISIISGVIWKRIKKRKQN